MQKKMIREGKFNPDQKAGLAVQFYISGGIAIQMVWCSPGEFLMGSPESDTQRTTGAESPQHRVLLTRGFWIGQTPVTQEIWQAVMGVRPPFFDERSKIPVDGIEWTEATEFCRRLTDLFRRKEALKDNERFELYSGSMPAGPELRRDGILETLRQS